VEILPMNTDKVTVREFAKRLGVKMQTVRKAVADGRILGIKRGQRIFIDWDSESEKFMATSSKIEFRNGRIAKEAKKVEAQEHLMSISEARMQKEIYSAKKAKVEYEKMIGKFVEVKEIEKVWRQVAITTQQSILAVVERTYQILAAEDNPHNVRKLLISELKASMTGLSIDKTPVPDEDFEDTEDEERLQ